MKIGKQKRRDAPVLQLRVKGPKVGRGRISVPDLIRLCEEAQNAVNRQAEALEGRKTMHPGPVAKTIRHQCTLELIGIKRGSTVLEFGWAEPQLTLALDMKEFGAEVIQELASEIKSLGNGKTRHDIDAGVLLSIYGLSGVVDQKTRGITEVDWMAPKPGIRKKIAGRITSVVRQRVAERLSMPRKAQVHVDGTLDMVDFKPKDRKCRIDPPIGQPIMCTFDADREDEIQKLLRKPVRVSGEATILPYTDRIESVHISGIARLPSLALGAGSFFADRSIAEVAKSQKVKPIRDASVLAGGIPDDVDLDDFLGDIYASR